MTSGAGLRSGYGSGAKAGVLQRTDPGVPVRTGRMEWFLIERAPVTVCRNCNPGMMCLR